MVKSDEHINVGGYKVGVRIDREDKTLKVMVIKNFSQKDIEKMSSLHTK
jgi:hypothetical protein